jgi:hypothetical protein
MGRNDLRSFIARVREDLATDDIDNIGARVWSGIADAAEKDLAIKDAYQRQRGTWYAVAELNIIHPNDNVPSVRTLDYVKCDRKNKAVKAARNLIRKHADSFSEHSWVEVEIRPAEEWMPDAGTDADGAPDEEV